MAGPSYAKSPGDPDRHGASSSGLSYERKGAASKPKGGPKLVKISWEDGTESHVTPQHAKDIRDQADRLRQSSRGFGRKDATNTP